MSAFVVSYNHINAIVHWAVFNKCLINFNINPDELGQILWDENVVSYNYRYSETGNAETFIYLPERARQLTDIELIQALRCLNYQSCQHDDWEKSEAFNYVERLITIALNKLGKTIEMVYELPEYQNAEVWDID
jgi:hypothetical protein